MCIHSSYMYLFALSLLFQHTEKCSLLFASPRDYTVSVHMFQYYYCPVQKYMYTRLVHACLRSASRFRSDMAATRECGELGFVVN